MKRSYAAIAASVIGLCAVILLAAFAVFGGGQKVYELASERAAEKPPASTVYVTENGDKFHREDCGSIADSQNLTSMQRDKAVEKGHQPCKICKP